MKGYLRNLAFVLWVVVMAAAFGAVGYMGASAQDHQCSVGWKWACADKSRTLLSSEDGKTHYCHKAQLESK